MPTYAYRCDACGHQFDAFQRFADDPLRDCPVCVGSVRRVIQPVGVVFKGSGWYITDSRPAPKDDAKPADAKAADGKATDAKATNGAKPAETEKPAEAKPAKAPATAAAD